MFVVNRTVLLPFSADKLFAMVQNVADYPQFMPNCTAASVEKCEGALTHAQLTFQLLGISDHFATANTASTAPDGTHCLHMQLLRGPFKSLQGDWFFKPLGEQGCKVSLHIEVDLGSVMQRLLGGQLERAAGNVIAAFTARAEAIYGAGNSASGA